MNYPNFFETIPTIKLQDPLSGFLGTFENGVMEFSYLDVVKSAGHSCPTVAGAYLSTLEGLKSLYPNEVAQRGAIKVEFAENQTDGVAGVIGAVIANITGATTDYGFKGIGGNFDRTNLMFFNQNIGSSVKFTRVDTGASVLVNYNPNSIPANPQMQPLMQKIMQGRATAEDKKRFGEVWQERVEAIFSNIDEVIGVISN
jgi:formylmethanofuran dehydrogenase subunit E